VGREENERAIIRRHDRAHLRRAVLRFRKRLGAVIRTSMVPVSILDLVPVILGETPREALRKSHDLAQHAEAFGYKRYWVAEHHNMTGIGSAATSVVIGYLAVARRRCAWVLA